MNGPHCFACACEQHDRPGKASSLVAVVLVWFPVLVRPFRLTPATEHRICTACDSLRRFVQAAIEANETARACGPWLQALVICDGGEGFTIRRVEQPAWPTQVKARA